jgi:hypothetical protein
VVPDEYAPARARSENALKEVLAGGPSAPAKAAALPVTGVLPAPHAAIVLSKKWDKGHVLTCRFLGGSRKQQAGVQAKAAMWEDFANITIKFVSRGDAEVRISFSADPGSWSAIGTDALVQSYFPKY